jgi:hypothetical protein
VNLAETAVLLAKAAAVDQRTVGEADVRAWQEILAHVDLPDALAAVTRHYAETADRLMPAHVIRHAKAIRADRKRLEAKTAPRELPSRFQDDVSRDDRITRGMSRAQAVLDLINARLAARREGATP